MKCKACNGTGKAVPDLEEDGYVYWGEGDPNPENGNIPKGCEYYCESDPKWIKENDLPCTWSWLKRRWPKPVVAAAAAAAAAEYVYWIPGQLKPATLPIGCETEIGCGGKWHPTEVPPESWGMCRRRWPKPAAGAVVGNIVKCPLCVRGLVTRFGEQVFCPTCGGKGSSIEWTSVEKSTVKENKNMLTKEEYELGLNTLMKPWVMLSEREKDAIRKAGLKSNSLQYLRTNGEWELKLHIVTQFNHGMIYRVDPHLDYDGKPTVVSFIRGLEMVFDDQNGDGLRFTVGKKVTFVNIHDLLDSLRDPKHNGANMDIAHWFDQHRKGGMYSNQ